MKNLSILLVLTIAVVMGSSCTTPVPKANLQNEVDSLSYAIGRAQAQDLKQVLIMRMGVDSASMNEFVKGFMEGANVDKNNKEQSAYLMGLQIGQQIGTNMLEGVNREFMNYYDNDSTKLANKQNLIAGFLADINPKDSKMSIEEAQMYFQTTSDNIKNAKMERDYAGNREAGIQFLEENKTKAGVITLPSGLQYKIIKVGKGAIPTATDRVKVNYRGTLIDGTEFESSRKEPSEFGVTQVIRGWTEALQLMPVGSKWELYVPQEIAYGSADRGKIKPFSTLIFEIELLEIVKK